MNAKARRMMGNKAAVATVKAKADRHAEHVLPIMEDIWNAGTQTLGGIASALNERGILTMRKAKWYPATVKSLLARFGLRGPKPAWPTARSVRLASRGRGPGVARPDAERSDGRTRQSHRVREHLSEPVVRQALS